MSVKIGIVWQVNFVTVFCCISLLVNVFNELFVIHTSHKSTNCSFYGCKRRRGFFYHGCFLYTLLFYNDTHLLVFCQYLDNSLCWLKSKSGKLYHLSHALYKVLTTTKSCNCWPQESATPREANESRATCCRRKLTSQPGSLRWFLRMK